MSEEAIPPQSARDTVYPPIAPIDAEDGKGDIAAVTVLNTSNRDADLVAGFGQLVQRVADLETAVQSLLAGGAVQAALPPTPGQSAVGTSLTEPLPDGETGSPSPGPMPEPAPPPDPVVQAWHSAPLALRLKFVRELLPAETPCQAALKEAQGLEDLRHNGRELETWLTGYPSLFADAVERLEARMPCGDGPPAELAQAILNEARQIFAAEVVALGIEWIVPTVGAGIGAEHEVVGEEEAALPAGRIARVKRRGFRRQGELQLPAQVTRSQGKRPNEASGPDNQTIATSRQPSVVGRQSTESPTHSGATGGPNALRGQPPAVIDPWPDWLRAFQQRSMGCTVPVIGQLLAALRGLTEAASRHAAGTVAEEALTARLEPLLPLLGTSHVPSLLGLKGEWGEVAAEARDGLMLWLRTTLEIVPVAPAVGERCDPATMQAIGTRRTAHAHEDGTVAKVERIGLRRGDRLLFRAQVLCYELGAGYE
jgi:hypothetical protein